MTSDRIYWTNPSLSPSVRGAYELDVRALKGSLSVLELGLTAGDFSVHGSEISEQAEEKKDDV